MGVSVPVHACPILSSPRKPSIRSASVTAGVIGGVTAGDCHGPALDQPIMLPHSPLLAQHLTARLFRRGRATSTRTSVGKLVDGSRCTHRPQSNRGIYRGSKAIASARTTIFPTIALL
jgi:hypothetical protein